AERCRIIPSYAGIDQYVCPMASTFLLWLNCNLSNRLRHGVESPMNEQQSWSDLIYEEQTRLAERELSSFISAVTELYGPAEARLSEKDWLEESESMDIAPITTQRNWRSITIAASARLASRLSL